MFQKLNKAYQKNKLNDDLMTNSTIKALRIISQMSKTIDDFRDFFSYDKKMHLCKLSEITKDACDIIDSTLQSSNIRLHIHHENEVSLYCLKNELSQVILNIIANAKDALVEKEVENPEINITIECKKKKASIIIDDNAGGIDESIIDKVFEPYFTTKGKDNGTGIGLYMSKTIIEEHMDGQLDVHNTLTGASFKITLPIKTEEKQ